MQTASVASMDGLTEAAASAASRVLFYPSVLYNLARSRLQAGSWHWHSAICEGVVLGALPLPGMLAELRALGVTAVVTLNQEHELFLSGSDFQEAGIAHLWLPTVDYLFAPPLADLHSGVDFIAKHAAAGGLVYVHCKAGRGRSATLALCYLVRQAGMTPAEAFEFIKERRPQICLARGQWEAVEEFYSSCCGGGAASASAPPSPGTPASAPGAAEPAAGMPLAEAEAEAETGVLNGEEGGSEGQEPQEEPPSNEGPGEEGQAGAPEAVEAPPGVQQLWGWFWR